MSVTYTPYILVNLDVTDEMQIQIYKQLFIEHKAALDLIFDRINEVGSHDFNNSNEKMLDRRLDVTVDDVNARMIKKNIRYSLDDVLQLYGIMEGAIEIYNSVSETHNRSVNIIPFTRWSLIGNVFSGRMMGDAEISLRLLDYFDDIPNGNDTAATLRLVDNKFYICGPFVEKKLQLVK